MNKIRAILAVVLLASLLLAACAPQSSAPAAGETPLKVIVLPILDALPLYVAQQEGYFTARGLKVELIPAASSAERDQLLVAGQADGMINEVVSTFFFNKEKDQVKIVRYARTATSTSAMFRILAAKNSGITAPAELKNVPIGISEGTVIAYLTDRLLQAESFQPQEIKTVAVPKIADRMTLLNSGELKAAMLPEPLSSLAMQQGAVVALDDTRLPDLSYSTYAFRTDVLEKNPAAVRAFVAAVDEAARKINEDPGKWKDLLAQQKIVPAPLLGAYEVPQFVTGGVPTQAQFEDVLAWAKAKGLVARDFKYSDCITSDFLPKP